MDRYTRNPTSARLPHPPPPLVLTLNTDRCIKNVGKCFGMSTAWQDLFYPTAPAFLCYFHHIISINASRPLITSFTDFIPHQEGLSADLTALPVCSDGLYNKGNIYYRKTRSIYLWNGSLLFYDSIIRF